VGANAAVVARERRVVAMDSFMVLFGYLDSVKKIMSKRFGVGDCGRSSVWMIWYQFLCDFRSLGDFNGSIGMGVGAPLGTNNKDLSKVLFIITGWLYHRKIL
jgi:hypothetical protein